MNVPWVVPKRPKEIVAFLLAWALFAFLYIKQYPGYPLTHQILAGFNVVAILWLLSCGIGYAMYRYQARGDVE